MRILIVEDEPTLGRQLKSTLEQTGYAVDLATDGEDGHFMGATEAYDAIILDLGLPEVDGLTVLDRWRKEGRVTPVLVLTARDSWSDKVAGLDAGGDQACRQSFGPHLKIAVAPRLCVGDHIGALRVSGNAAVKQFVQRLRHPLGKALEQGRLPLCHAANLRVARRV